MELDNVYYSGSIGLGGTLTNDEPTPDQVAVIIEYDSDGGDHYRDVFPLDTSLIKDRTYVESSRSPTAQREKIAMALQEIHRVLARKPSHPTQLRGSAGRDHPDT